MLIYPTTTKAYMDKKIPIILQDELEDEVITSHAFMNLASGEISDIKYENYNVKTEGLPAKNSQYTYTCGTMRFQDKEVEFVIEVDTSTGEYSVNTDELQELKEKAAELLSPQPAKKVKKNK